jgi:hypothetical protein
MYRSIPDSETAPRRISKERNRPLQIVRTAFLRVRNVLGDLGLTDCTQDPAAHQLVNDRPTGATSYKS